MKKSVSLLSVLWFFCTCAGAVELMKWERIPLQIPLTVGQERIILWIKMCVLVFLRA